MQQADTAVHSEQEQGDGEDTISDDNVFEQLPQVPSSLSISVLGRRPHVYSVLDVIFPSSPC